MTTYVSYVNALEALTISGVTRKHTSGQPISLNTADLPGQWVDVPTGAAVPATCAGDFSRTLVANIVIALEPVGQNKRPVNFDACVVMMDSIHTALVAYNGNSGLDAPISWNSRLMFVTVNTVDYWAVVTDVTAALA